MKRKRGEAKTNGCQYRGRHNSLGCHPRDFGETQSLAPRPARPCTCGRRQGEHASVPGGLEADFIVQAASVSQFPLVKVCFIRTEFPCSDRWNHLTHFIRSKKRQIVCLVAGILCMSGSNTRSQSLWFSGCSDWLCDRDSAWLASDNRAQTWRSGSEETHAMRFQYSARWRCPF